MKNQDSDLGSDNTISGNVYFVNEVDFIEYLTELQEEKNNHATLEDVVFDFHFSIK